MASFVSCGASAQLSRMPDNRSHVPASPGPRFERRVPDGDTMERYVCGDCGHIYYSNPKIVVGSVVAHHERIMVCCRAIDPRKSFGPCPRDFSNSRKRPKTARAAKPATKRCARLISTGCSRSTRCRGFRKCNSCIARDRRHHILQRARKASPSKCSPGKIFRGRSLPFPAWAGR